MTYLQVLLHAEKGSSEADISARNLKMPNKLLDKTYSPVIFAVTSEKACLQQLREKQKTSQVQRVKVKSVLDVARYRTCTLCH